MPDLITVVGSIGGAPEPKTTRNGDPMLKFRLASNDRKRDSSGAWVDGETSWYSVTVYGNLATNAAASLQSGHRVIVTGSLVLHEYTSQDQKRIDAQLTASALGHDLKWGTTSYTRTTRAVAPVAPVAEITNQPTRDLSDEWAQPVVAHSGAQVTQIESARTDPIPSDDEEPGWFSVM